MKSETINNSKSQASSEKDLPREQSHANSAASATETIVPSASNTRLSAPGTQTLVRETLEQTRQLRTVSAMLKLVVLGTVVGALALFVGLIYLVRDILALVVISFLIAYILGPIVDALERKRLNRTLVVIIIMLVILSAFATLSTLVVSNVAEQVTKIHSDIRNKDTGDLIVNIVVDRLNSLPDIALAPFLAYQKRLEKHENILQKNANPYIAMPQTEKSNGIETELGDSANAADIRHEKLSHMVRLAQEQTLNYIANQSEQILSMLSNSARGAFSALTTGIISLFLTFFLLNDAPHLRKSFIEIVPNRFFEPVLILVNQLDQQLGNYLRSRLIQTAALSMFFAVGYWSLGLRFAITLGIVAGLANLIPYIGPLIGAVPALIVVFLGSHLSLGWGLLAILGLTLIAQLIDNAIIFPLIIGKSVELGPVMTIVAVLLGERFLGLVGLLMAVPITAMLKLIFQEIYTEFKGYTRSIVHGN